jgi:hypothetical protein
VFVNPVEGRDDELNNWYYNVHWPEAKSAGMPPNALTRYEAAPVTADRQPAPFKYLMLYDLGDDPIAVMKKVAAARGSFTPPPDAVDLKSIRSWVFRKHSEGE